jgi:phage tail sheath protein FI
MAFEYKYGTYGEITDSIVHASAESGTSIVYIGTAPVGLIRGYAGAVNTPIVLKSMSDVDRLLGRSKNWNAFTLSEVAKVHFDNPLGNVGPITVVNVLNPAVHKKGTATSATLTFASGRAEIDSDTIVLDTLALEDLVEGTDYAVSIDFDLGKVVISSLGDEPITGDVDATYNEMDPSLVTATDIIGEATPEGSFKGIGAVQLVYQTTGQITNVIAAPKWSETPAVYKALEKAASKINDHWDAYFLADIPIMAGNTPVDTIAKAIAWKASNGYNSGFSKVFWPQAADVDEGKLYHLSAIGGWLMLKTDIEHGSIPMETPANKEIPADMMYFGETSTNQGFDRKLANSLTEVGITTGLFWGGSYKLWGDHTAKYDVNNQTLDPKYFFDPNIRMLMHVTNSFQERWNPTIDKPVNRNLIDTILNREGEELAMLVAVGALIGDPIVQFVETDNPLLDLIQGQFVFAHILTTAPPAKALTAKVTWTDEGFASLFE